MSRRLSGDLAHLIAAQVGPLLSSVGLVWVTASLLGAAGRGEFAFVAAVANLVGQMFSLSLHLGAANALVERRETQARAQLALAAWIAAGVVALGTPIAAVAAQASSWGEGLILAPGLSAIVLLYLVLSRVIQGIGENRTFQLVQSTSAALSFLCGFLAAKVTGRAGVVLVAWGLSLAVMALLAWLRLRPRIRGLRRSPIHPRIGWDALALHAGVMGQQLLFRADLIVLGLIVSAANMGIYSVASPIVNTIFVLAEASSLAVFGYAGRSRRNQELRRRELTRLYFQIAPVLAVAVLGLTALILPRVLPGYGAVPALVALMLPGAILQGYARIALSSRTALSDTGTALRMGGFSAGLALVYFPAVWIAGIWGAAVATSLLYSLQAAYMYWRVGVRRGRLDENEGLRVKGPGL